MLEPRFKIAIWLAVLFFTSLPLIGILNGPSKGPAGSQPVNQPGNTRTGGGLVEPAAEGMVVTEDMVRVPAGPFIQGTEAGGFDELPERTISLDEYFIDRYEVTNHQYQAFVLATGHRRPGPPSRYAKNMALLRGANQPVVYVSWYDASAYCHWKGLRLPAEAEWEKAMRGIDGRLWPWGNHLDASATNWAEGQDGYKATAPVGSFPRDVSPFGVADGAGNLMEWVADWYAEDSYRSDSKRNPQGPDHGVYKVLRGGGYTSTGQDIRITSRNRMVPDFRDETIGFRCAGTGKAGGDGTGLTKTKPLIEGQSNRGSGTPPA